MPLLSAEASGKVADVIVFFTWKGRNVVRSWTIPTNPRDIDQRIIRQKLAACGKNCAYIKTPTTGLLNGSAMYALIRAATPSGQIWNAYLVKKIMDHVKTELNFTTLSSDLFGGTAAALTCWQTCATTLGFEDLTGAAYATTISPELQLFMGAYGAYLMELSGVTDIYNDYPTNWVESKIINFATDYYTAA